VLLFIIGRDIDGQTMFFAYLGAYTIFSL